MKTGCCATSASASSRARRSPWWGIPGAGKTTLASLLLRFYDVQRGSIKIGGIDMREFALDDLRRHFGVVLQDPYLFTGTIESNIRLGSAIDQTRD